MMKVKNEKETFIIPSSGGIYILSCENPDLLITYLSSYFIQKRKTKCIVVDDEDQMIDYDNCKVIYVSKYESIDQWFDFKPKTLFSNELNEFVVNNQNMFRSFESIRHSVYDLLTDHGMYKFQKILEKDSNMHIEINMENYDFRSIFSLMKIDTEELSRSQKFMLIYNLYMYIYRDTFKIVLIDFDVTDDVYHWLAKKYDTNMLILVVNESLHHPVKTIFDGIIKLSHKNFIETITVSLEQTDLFSYLLHPVIQANKSFQSEKNLKTMQLFDEKETTFIIDFADEEAF